MSTIRRPGGEPRPGFARDRDIDIDIELAHREARSLRWGPIWGGVLTAFGLFLLLTLLAIGLGVQRLGGEDADVVATLTGSAIGLASLVAGGFIAGWSAVAGSTARGVLYGFLVWALWIALIILLAAFGFAQALGALGTLFTQISAPDVDVTQAEALEAIQAASLQSFFALALTAGAATLGGALGAMALSDRQTADEAD